MENSVKSISTINPAIMENTDCLIVKTCISFINLKMHGCVAWSWCINTLSSLWWVTFQAKDNVRSTPASFALILVLHWSHNVRTANHHLCAGQLREFMGPRANYKCGAIANNWHIWVILVCRLYLVSFADMWDLKACPEEILRIRPTEIEF